MGRPSSAESGGSRQGDRGAPKRRDRPAGRVAGIECGTDREGDEPDELPVDEGGQAEVGLAEGEDPALDRLEEPGGGDRRREDRQPGRGAPAATRRAGGDRRQEPDRDEGDEGRRDRGAVGPGIGGDRRPAADTGELVGQAAGDADRRQDEADRSSSVDGY